MFHDVNTRFLKQIDRLDKMQALNDAGDASVALEQDNQEAVGAPVAQHVHHLGCFSCLVLTSFALSQMSRQPMFAFACNPL